MDFLSLSPHDSHPLTHQRLSSHPHVKTLNPCLPPSLSLLPISTVPVTECLTIPYREPNKPNQTNERKPLIGIYPFSPWTLSPFSYLSIHYCTSLVSPSLPPHLLSLMVSIYLSVLSWKPPPPPSPNDVHSGLGWNGEGARWALMVFEKGWDGRDGTLYVKWSMGSSMVISLWIHVVPSPIPIYRGSTS
jgi:hypothetical protein